MPWSAKSKPRLRACWVTPGARWVGRAAGQPDAAARMGDEEQGVEAAQEHALNGEEVARDDARRLRPEELAPVGPLAPRRRIEPRSGEQAADAGRRDLEAELGQLATDPCPNAGSPARTAAQAPGSLPTAAAVRAAPTAVAISGERAPDASAVASAESPKARRARSAAGGRLPPRAGPDQQAEASAARPGGAEPRAHGALPTTRRPSRPDHGGSVQARRAAPAQRGRERRRPCRRSSQPPRRQEATRILAPFTPTPRHVAQLLGEVRCWLADERIERTIVWIGEQPLAISG
jgi:hypothetical protein